MELKDFQKESLAKLDSFLRAARAGTLADAFEQVAKKEQADLFRPYRPLSDAVADAPFVCLRLPTGGGKTILATHAVKTAAEAWLATDTPLVLWLVPTSMIRDQTLDALKNPLHPYRKALDAACSGRVRVLALSDFTNLRPQDLATRTNILIGTLATARVDKTENRKVYEHHEDLEPFFTRGVPDGLNLERDPENGKVKHSFVNLLSLVRPLVIVDEAHNNKSPLSLEVMNRIRPSCVVEFTATPAAESNILHHVAASTLQKEQMIKMPIELTQHDNWQLALHAAVQEQARLKAFADAEKEYLRPIVLIQAENKDKDVSVDVVREYLLSQENIPEEQVAVATGEQRELEGVNLFDPTCPVRFVITVQALKEGWDCSFAYIFCSLATVHSTKDVEQLLGRVLRMPYARCRQAEALNRAYAHVSSASWPTAIVQLRDRLVSMGFDETEAERAIREQRAAENAPAFAFRYPDATEGLPLFEARVVVKEPPALSHLDAVERDYVTVRPTTDGHTEIVLSAQITDAALHKVEQALKPADRASLREQMAIRRRQDRRRNCPAEKGAAFSVPQLMIRLDGALYPVDEELYLREGVRLADLPVALEAADFEADEGATRYLVGINDNRMFIRTLRRDEVDLNGLVATWDETEFVRFLAPRLRHKHIPPTVMKEYLRRVIVDLNERRGLSLAVLQAAVFKLEDVLKRKIAKSIEQAKSKGFDTLLFSKEAQPEVGYETPYVFPKADAYTPPRYYKGKYDFQRHFYADVAAFDSGEEENCAWVLDNLPQVEYWVRNIANDDRSYRFPKAGGDFYPDFVALLKDGRRLVVEYKGEGYKTTDDSKEKNLVARLAASASKGQLLYLMAVQKDEHGRTVEGQLKALLGNAK